MADASKMREEPTCGKEASIRTPSSVSFKKAPFSRDEMPPISSPLLSCTDGLADWITRLPGIHSKIIPEMRNEAESRIKHQVIPKAATSNPPSAGPIILDICSITELMETA
ncbi:hypothetical protein D3C76_1415590 [compost metagenome]